MKTIHDFKKGDEIVRVKPAKSYGVNIFGEQGSGDRSYMGEKLIYVGIANGQIYLKSTDPFYIKMFDNELIDLALDCWDEGWEAWIDPKTLLDDTAEVVVDKKILKQRIQAALDREDYETAEKLKKQLENL